MKPFHRAGIALTFALVLPLATLAATAQQPDDGPATPDAAVATEQEKVVTEAGNGSAVTLSAGEVLVVRLNDTPSTGYSRALVSFPDMPVRLVSHRILAPAAAGAAPVVGAPRVAEWRFVVAGEAAHGRAVWLKFLRLRPFAKGVDAAGLWEVNVTVPPKPAAQ